MPDTYTKTQEIGGYFHLEIGQGKIPHQGGMLLNSGRNALEYILRSLSEIRRLWLPYYTCDVVLEPLEKLGVSYSFYHIDDKFHVADEIKLAKNEYLLYTNYFGLMDGYVRQLASQFGQQLIVDNAQAWYADPIKDVSTFFSPRKFFGLPDGGIAFCSCGIDDSQYETDISYERCSHLLKRIDLGAEMGYADFKRNSLALIAQPIRRMSTLTKALLSGIDFKQASTRRIDNFRILDAALHNTNKLSFTLADDSVPMVYPYLADDFSLKQYLINNHVYVATYWPNVLKWCKEKDWEYNLAQKVCFLPIDQRYDEKQMTRIIELILGRKPEND